MAVDFSQVKSMMIPVPANTQGLPYDAEVEYLESTGTQYITVPYMYAQYDKWTVDAQITQSTGTTQVLIDAAEAQAGQWLGASSSGKWTLGGGVDFTTDGTVRSSITTTFSNQGISATIGVETKTRSGTLSPGNVDLFAAKLGDGQAYYYSKAKIYSVVATGSAGTITLQPVRKNGVGYFYDKVSGQLFGNSGTGSLIYGNDLAISRYPVDAITSGGQLLWHRQPYVTDGLIAWYDGLWNVGFGEHSNSTSNWKDLSPNGWDATARGSTGWQWIDKAYNGQSNAGSGYGNGIGFVCPIALATALKNNLSTGFTVEVVFAPDASRRMSVFSQYGGGTGFEYYPQSYAGVWRSYFSGAPDVWANCWTTAEPNAVRTAATVVTGSGVNAYVDGVLKTQNVNQPADTTILDDSPHPFVLGGENSRPNMSIDGRLYCVRVYSRALTAAELVANAAVDSGRFSL